MRWFFAALLAGLFAASPFLTNRALGTREAYNYSLAVADAVTQFRQGQIPALVGQSEYAFNGRIHPLRTAPALPYVAGVVDLLTFRQLSFWSLQNLALALGLVGLAAASYASLRLATPAMPPLAALLAGILTLSPPVLAAAYGMDLYMTVLAAPCVPLVLAANVTAFSDRERTRWVLLGAGLAACWLAHPPVALWMTLTTVLLQATALIVCRPTLRGWIRTLGAVALLAVLAGFGFVSALSVSPYGDIVHQHDTSLLLAEVKRAFHASLMPVSRRADQLGDFQAGYPIWALAIVALAWAMARRRGVALVLLLTGGLLLLFTLPVPGIHAWLWDNVPTLVLNLTNQWPMQRLYLPFATLVTFAFALAWRTPTVASRAVHDGLRLGLVVVVGWTAWQGSRFVARGFATRQTAEATRWTHLPGNLDLTPISYALVGTPPDFTNGTMDPAFGFRLLAPFDAHPIASNWSAPLPATAETQSLRLVARPGDREDLLELSERLTLKPGRRYRLTFAFVAPPLPAMLQIQGRAVRREYPLPSAGGPQGFGMVAANNRSISLWTDLPVPEEVSFRLVGAGLARSAWRGRVFADLQVEPVTTEALPFALQTLVPLRLQVRAATAGYLETPRMYLPGYAAFVDGRPVRTQRSPERRLMLPVTAGDHGVEIRYAGSDLLLGTFWLSALGWCGLGLWGLSRVAPASIQARLRQTGDQIVAGVRRSLRSIQPRHWLAPGALVLVAGLTLALVSWQADRNVAGPVRVRFMLPQGETNRQQPLVVTGRPNAGLFVYVVYHDAEHVRIGVDSWGRFGYQSDPIRTDYFAVHELVVEAGSLYPPGHSALHALEAKRAEEIKRRLRVSYDGQVVIDRDVDTHASEPGEVTIGHNLIGGSSCEPRFSGEIIFTERLPLLGR